MNIKLKEDFITLWKKLFKGAELPITFYYTNEEGHAELVKPSKDNRCVIAALSQARKGKAISFNEESIGCPGGKRYLGFRETEPDIEYLLAAGIPGKVEGERYKKTTKIAAETIKLESPFKAPARFIVFKRWDLLNSTDDPEVVIFFVDPDGISALFTLANFDETEINKVFTPWGSGCSSIIQYPFREKESVRPRAIIGMFDISARRHFSEDLLTFAVPIFKFEAMVRNMEESFLTTKSWRTLQKRTKIPL